jgi:hypothetical protein
MQKPFKCPVASSTPAKLPTLWPTARILRLPIVIDGVWIGNEFLRIGPGLRSSIRAMAAEGRR